MALSVFGIDFGTNNIKIYNGISKTITNEKNIIAIKINPMITKNKYNPKMKDIIMKK